MKNLPWICSLNWQENSAWERVGMGYRECHSLLSWRRSKSSLRTQFSQLLHYKAVASLPFILLVNEKAPIVLTPPITHLAASPLLHFMPNQYYLTTYRSAMMAVISAAWKLQKKLLFVLKLRATEINRTFENWYRPLSIGVFAYGCVYLHVFVQEEFGGLTPLLAT